MFAGSNAAAPPEARSKINGWLLLVFLWLLDKAAEDPAKELIHEAIAVLVLVLTTVVPPAVPQPPGLPVPGIETPAASPDASETKVAEVWQADGLKDITRRDVRDLVEEIAERRLRKGTTEDGQETLGAPIMANRVLALVKKMFHFALDREWIDANPAARLKPVSPESRRDRVLSPEEIRTLWRQLDSEPHRIATLFRTQLLTAQRPGEVSKMRWAQLDPALFERTTDGVVVLPSKLEPVVWTIPAKEAKNGLAHEVPLSAAVIELLRDLAKRDEEERAKINTLYRAKKHQPAGEPSEYVFPSRTRKGPIGPHQHQPVEREPGARNRTNVRERDVDGARAARQSDGSFRTVRATDDAVLPGCELCPNSCSSVVRAPDPIKAAEGFIAEYDAVVAHLTAEGVEPSIARSMAGIASVGAEPRRSTQVAGELRSGSRSCQEDASFGGSQHCSERVPCQRSVGFGACVHELLRPDCEGFESDRCATRAQGCGTGVSNQQSDALGEAVLGRAAGGGIGQDRCAANTAVPIKDIVCSIMPKFSMSRGEALSPV